MRLRIKVQNSRSNLDVEGGITLRGFKSIITEKLKEQYSNVPEFHISLNGSDPVTEDDSVALASIGVVQGDLLHILLLKNDANIILEFKEGPAQKTVCKQLKDNHVSMETEHVEDRKMYTSSKPALPPPIFLHEGVTSFLSELYEASSPSTLHDALFLVLKALMYEGGLKVQIKDETGLPQNKEDFWQLWKKPGGVYKAPFILPGYPKTSCSFVSMSVGQYLACNASVIGKEQRLFQIKLRVSKYVRGEIPLTTGPTAVYQNLREVSKLFKDQIVLPVLAEFRRGFDIPVPFNSLLGIPAELKFQILRYLDIKTLLKMALVCKEFYFIGNDSELWRIMCMRDFKGSDIPEGCGDWKQVYISNYKRKKSESAIPRRGVMHWYTDRYLHNTYCQMYRDYFGVPGIRGGVYDLIPGFQGIPSRNGGFGERLRPRFDPVHPFTEQSSSSFFPTGFGSVQKRTKFL